ncbi:DUF968 domain-containing protein, partial [Escherichia coli]|uniref:DUF968 domain-containing protein n=1 Tax=Escherichia coli TaxID=562 RepID=UPI0024DECF78
DPHHLIGHGQGGMGTKAHDLFVLPLCRKHHDELHVDIRTITHRVTDTTLKVVAADPNTVSGIKSVGTLIDEL